MKSNRWDLRDATMVLVAYKHGLRAAELVDLRWVKSTSKRLPCTSAGSSKALLSMHCRRGLLQKPRGLYRLHFRYDLNRALGGRARPSALAYGRPAPAPLARLARRAPAAHRRPQPGGAEALHVPPTCLGACAAARRAWRDGTASNLRARAAGLFLL